MHVAKFFIWILTGLITINTVPVFVSAKSFYNQNDHLLSDNSLLPQFRQRRGITDTVKGWLGFGNSNKQDGTNSNTDNGHNPQPPSPDAGTGSSSGTNNNGVSSAGNNGVSSGGNVGNGGPPPSVREGPPPSGNGDRQQITGNKWIDIAIGAFRGGGDNSGGGETKSVAGRIADALGKEAVKAVLAGILGG